jgi:hypothetical protein
MAAGYDSYQSYLNIGLPLYVLGLSIAGVLLCWIIRAFFGLAFKHEAITNHLAEKIIWFQENILYNSICLFFIEACLETFLSIALSLILRRKYEQSENDGE